LKIDLNSCLRSELLEAFRKEPILANTKLYLKQEIYRYKNIQDPISKLACFNRQETHKKEIHHDLEENKTEPVWALNAKHLDDLFDESEAEPMQTNVSLLGTSDNNPNENVRKKNFIQFES
jgi:hypothetical protein